MSGTAPPPGYSEEPELQPAVPAPGFSVTPPARFRPGFDPADSPLKPGGREDSPAPVSMDSRLSLLEELPADLADRPRVTFRVRREGWVARRSAARARYRTIDQQRGASTPRILHGLQARGGLLQRSRSRAVRARFDMRALHRSR
jgi:hypothetical protein